MQRNPMYTEPQESVTITHTATDTFATVLTNLRSAMDRTKLKYNSCIQFNATIYPIQNLGGYGQFSNNIVYSTDQFYCLSLDVTNAKATLYGSIAGKSDVTNNATGSVGSVTLYY